MRNFTNKFQFAFNADHSEVTLNFFDVYPIIPEGNGEGENLSTDTELISSLVMTGDTALELANLLKKSLE